MKERGITDGLTMNQLAERNAEHVTTIAALEARCAALVAENAGLKSAFDKPQAYLSWHAIPPTWEDALPCGEYLDVHDDADHKNSDGTDCWLVYAKPEIKTPATDAFLAEVRAQGVELFAESQKEYVRKNRNELDSMTRAAYCGSAVDAERFAAELRKGVNQ
ncbi:hypothetical protein ID902_001792 [Salmonella enterica subsp. enterica serovar Orion]|nr:hypothetical protein [Salmonella enterica]EGA8859199.1 hypothetical protein [Salmonella enterica subsp. enterica serovar Orion]EGH2523105.1 hypothetical protein [Salmonella enterica subsp. enterica serovar Orion]